jgi:hypothetical protein
VASNDLKQIKELTSDNVLTSAYLILAECEKLKARLALELQAVRDDRKAQQKEFSEFMVYLRETLDGIRAKHLIEAQLLDLVRRPNVGDQKRGQKETQTKTDGILSFRR